MATFVDVRDELVDEVLNSHPETQSFMAKAMVRTLQALQSETVPFMEVSGSFVTVNGTATYTSTTPVGTGFPANLLGFRWLYYDLGASPGPIYVVPLEEVRTLQEYPSAAYPHRVAWAEKKLQFGPAPAGAYTVKWDGFLDSTLATTGAVITTASTTVTNPWLVEGLVAFKHLVLSDYYRSDPAAVRPDMAENHAQLAAFQLNSLRSAQKKRSDMGTSPRIPNAFQSALYPDESDSRVSLLHPGAPV